jgi:type IV secretion system protein VirB4
MEAWLYEGREHSGADPWELLKGFIDRTDRIINLVEGFVPEAEWLNDPATLTYLHSTVSTKRHRVRVPETPMHLDALLADQPLAGGLSRGLATSICVRSPSSDSRPRRSRILDDLNRLAFVYRWSTRAIMLDKTDATRLVTKIRRQWFAKRKSVAAILKEVMTNEASVLMDTDAANKAADADAALQDLGSDQVGEAYVTATVTVWAPIVPSPTKVATGREGHPVSRLHLHRRRRQRHRSLARLHPRPDLRERPPAAGLDAQSCAHDAAVGGLGRVGAGRTSRRAAIVLRQD